MYLPFSILADDLLKRCSHAVNINLHAVSKYFRALSINTWHYVCKMAVISGGCDVVQNVIIRLVRLGGMV